MIILCNNDADLSQIGVVVGCNALPIRLLHRAPQFRLPIRQRRASFDLAGDAQCAERYPRSRLTWKHAVTDQPQPPIDLRRPAGPQTLLRKTAHHATDAVSEPLKR